MRKKENLFSHQRCTICNAVSSAEISDDFGRFSSRPFYNDPVDGVICFECRESYQDALYEFEDDVQEPEELDDYEDE